MLRVVGCRSRLLQLFHPQQLVDEKRPSVDPKKLSPDFGGSGPSVSQSPRWSPSRTTRTPRGLFLYAKMQVAELATSATHRDRVVLWTLSVWLVRTRGIGSNSSSIRGTRSHPALGCAAARESPRASAWCWQCIQNMKARHGKKHGDPQLEANTCSFRIVAGRGVSRMQFSRQAPGRERRDRPRRSSGLSTPPRRP